MKGVYLLDRIFCLCLLFHCGSTNNHGSRIPSHAQVSDEYVETENFKNWQFMDPEKKYFLEWNLNDTHIIFKVQVQTLGWVGLGLSPTGAMTNSDIAVMWITDGKLTLQDRFAKGFFEPLLDEQSDWIPMYSAENETHTIVKFARLLDTCDVNMDRKITKDTVHVLYAYHSEDPPNGQLMKHEHRGHKSIVFIGGTPTFEEPKYDHKFSVRATKYKISEVNQTSYRCFLSQIKDIKKDYNLIATNVVLSPGNENIVHHILVHLCDNMFTNPKKVDNFFCYEDSHSGDVMRRCYTELLTVWAVGTDGYTYPKDVGFPFGKNLNGRWVVLEVHYNNPQHLKGLVDSSGMDLYLTAEKQKIQSGMLFLGLFEFLWGLIIPPRQKQFKAYTFCSKECIDTLNIPEEGLTVFAYFLHSHLAGRKIQLSIIRDGKQLPPEMTDDNYDFDYQVIRGTTKPVKLMKGDSLFMECTYTSEKRPNITLSGFSTADEMCIGYIYYYPKRELTLCGSMPDYQDLAKKLDLNVQINISAVAEILQFKRQTYSYFLRDEILTKLQSRDWTDEKVVKNLQDVYRETKYLEICRYMPIPLVNEKPFPKFEPFIKPDEVCENKLKTKAKGRY